MYRDRTCTTFVSKRLPLHEQKMAAEFIRQFQIFSESDKQWKAREEFILRNLEHFREESEMDHLLALSMVWANHIFMGCRYNDELLERVFSMSEGIEVKDAPNFTTRDQIMKQTFLKLKTGVQRCDHHELRNDCNKAIQE